MDGRRSVQLRTSAEEALKERLANENKRCYRVINECKIEIEGLKKERDEYLEDVSEMISNAEKWAKQLTSLTEFREDLKRRMTSSDILCDCGNSSKYEEMLANVEKQLVAYRKVISDQEVLMGRVRGLATRVENLITRNEDLIENYTMLIAEYTQEAVNHLRIIRHRYGYNSVGGGGGGGGNN